MFVDIAMLHSGANESDCASRYADEGAKHLSRTSPVSGIFGDFTAADSFHEAISAAHTHHTKALRAHRENLSTIGSKAHQAAAEFTDMDEYNSAKFLVVQCNYET